MILQKVYLKDFDWFIRVYYAVNYFHIEDIIEDLEYLEYEQLLPILNVNKIDYEGYLEIVEMNNNDPYLKCHSRQEQNLIDNLEDRLEIDLNNQKAKYDKQARLQRVTYKIKKTKILEKFSWEDSDYVYAY